MACSLHLQANHRFYILLLFSWHACRCSRPDSYFPFLNYSNLFCILMEKCWACAKLKNSPNKNKKTTIVFMDVVTRLAFSYIHTYQINGQIIIFECWLTWKLDILNGQTGLMDLHNPSVIVEKKLTCKSQKENTKIIHIRSEVVRGVFSAVLFKHSWAVTRSGGLISAHSPPGWTNSKRKRRLRLCTGTRITQHNGGFVRLCVSIRFNTLSWI